MVNFLGSKASRTASPMKVMSVKVITKEVKALATIQGAMVKLATPCLSNSPMLGVGGGNPNPRKSRAVTAVMPDTTVNGINVITVAIELGSMCLKIIRTLLAPRTFAAAV